MTGADAPALAPALVAVGGSANAGSDSSLHAAVEAIRPIAMIVASERRRSNIVGPRSLVLGADILTHRRK
ncbi:hypothetical protein Axi01nite_52570 [Actinoplanes xinjiangensis]|nr:hypothetical protein Axi01nite_52570 [Actinoplanes xinjiangensis]